MLAYWEMTYLHIQATHYTMKVCALLEKLSCTKLKSTFLSGQTPLWPATQYCVLGNTLCVCVFEKI